MYLPLIACCLFWIQIRVVRSGTGGIECEGPIEVPNTYRVLNSTGEDNGTLTVGAMWYYQCVERHTPVLGDAYRKCLPSGEWDGEDLDCEANSCPALSRPDNGAVMYLSLDIGSTATYICFEGYMVSFGDTSRTCQTNGQWSGLEPTCETIKCPQPEPVDHSFMVVGSNEYNTYVTYTCYPYYYAIKGNLDRRCTVAAVWDGSLPFCAEIICPTPLPKNRAIPRFTGLKFKDTVSYECEVGTSLSSGNQTRTCNDQAVWSGEDPVCDDIRCPIEPPDVQNATATTDSEGFGALATYSCNKGHVNAGGNFVSVCQDDGTWSDITLNCTPVYCGKAPWYVGAKSNVTGEMFGDTAVFDCYIYPDDNIIYWIKFCDRDGNWVGNDPECTAGWYKKRFEPEPVEAEGSVWIGIVVLGIFITIILAIIVVDIATLGHHFAYLKRNLRDFRKTAKKQVRIILAQPRLVKFSRRFKHKKIENHKLTSISSISKRENSVDSNQIPDVHVTD
ncbi:hypothetical protein SNE40_016008 [Patella caerulea]|uniref:Sushi domain-containing protein n=1 Tax=Patella caerulea TaxID=87958 RepID=A0AAN8JCZ4_PATCE